MTKQEKLRKKFLHTYLADISRTYKSIGDEHGVSRTTVYCIVRRYLETLSTARCTGSGRKKGPANPNLKKKIVRDFHRNPGTSNRDRAKKFAVSEGLIRKIKKNENLHSYKAIKYPNCSEKQESTAKSRTRKLYSILNKTNCCLILDDETYVKKDYRQLPGNIFNVSSIRGKVHKKYKYVCVDRFAPKVMVWQAICGYGLKRKVFVTNSNINSDVYVKECLQKRLLPFIKSHEGPTLFWPDLASCHYSKKTVQ